MTTRHVDLLNIGLMLGACAAAFALPFELFLWAYAILGPLHYLTEISWLHQRDYFAVRRRDAGWLVALCVAVLLVQFRVVGVDVPTGGTVLNAAAIGAALAIVFLRETGRRLVLIGAATGVGLLLSERPAGQDWLFLFLPSLVHVWVFTGAFVLLGALRGRSVTGGVSLAVFVACSAWCFLGGVGPPPASMDFELAASYQAIVPVNQALSEWLGLGPLAGAQEVFFSDAGRKVARFVAFAYTYHYLNWFSKTSIIQWHRIPRAWTYLNLALWVGSVALYAWDYTLGLTALFALSYLHVFLELPLNGRTFAGLGQTLFATRRAG